MGLTPLGQRTLDGFKQKYGDAEGERRFNAALQSGMLDRAKMEDQSDATAKRQPKGNVGRGAKGSFQARPG